MRTKVVILFLLTSCSISFAQDSYAQKNGWLFGVIFKIERMRDKAIEDIQKYEGEIQKCDNTIRKSQNIIRQAQEKGNAQAEMIAREALAKAQEAKIKNAEKKNSAELNKIRAEGTLATVKNELSNALSHPQAHPNEIKSVITNHSGRVEIQKENGEIIGFGKNQIGLLEKGDEIVTYGNSSAELQLLEGRGSLKVAEYSKVKMGEDDKGTQILNMLRGKAHIGVEKMDEYLKMLDEKLKEYKEEISNIPEDYEKFTKRLKAQIQKKFEVRTQGGGGAVRGTEFLVFEDDKTGTEIIVLEGSIEMKGTKGEKTIIVNAGHKGTATKGGILSDPEKIDLSKIERWWER